MTGFFLLFFQVRKVENGSLRGEEGKPDRTGEMEWICGWGFFVIKRQGSQSVSWISISRQEKMFLEKVEMRET